MQVWRLLYTNLVGPRGEKLESTEPFWTFFLFIFKWEVHMSFPRDQALVGDVAKLDKFWMKKPKLDENRIKRGEIFILHP